MINATRQVLLILLAVAMNGSDCLSAEHLVALTPGGAADLLVKERRPDYPIEARRRHMTGAGKFVLYVDSKSGDVTSIKIEKSTGHQILDVACLKALIQWRFKPGTVTKSGSLLHFQCGDPSR
jgi:TonB family protein